MPRAKNGVGRRYKKRRTSPASAIEVEQIEEGGVEELVVVEGETEEVAEIAIVEFGEDVVMWVLDHVLEKVWADRDWQADRFLRYASLLSLVVREWKRQGRGTVGPFYWAVQKISGELALAGREYEYTACDHGISCDACNVSPARVFSIGAGACKSVRAALVQRSATTLDDLKLLGGLRVRYGP